MFHRYRGIMLAHVGAVYAEAPSHPLRVGVSGHGTSAISLVARRRQAV